VQKLFGEGPWREQESIAERYAERASGHVRIVRLGGSRLGIPTGTSLGEIPEFTYELAGRRRTLRPTGNRLGDNAAQVIFELVEKEGPAPEEVAPKVSTSDESDGKEQAGVEGEQA